MRRLFRVLLLESVPLLLISTIVAYSLLTFMTNEFILTDNVMYNSLIGLLPEDYIENAISFQRKWAWVGYVILPVILFLKYIFVSAFVATGAVFSGHDLSFKNIFKVVMISEWLYILVGVISIMLLLIFRVNSLEDIQNLNLVRLLSLGFLLMETAPSWLVTPLFTLNIFELLYITLIVIGIGEITKEATKKSILWVITSYGSSLLLWIILLTYINVSYA